MDLKTTESETKVKKIGTRILAILILVGSFCSFAGPDPVLNVMAPLFIGDPSNEDYLHLLIEHRPTPYERDWEAFRHDLRRLKADGITSVSVDVWWGVVQRRGADVFDWSYYRRLFDLIVKEGMSIKAILSTHSCGGNIGDNVRVQIPWWVWQSVSPDNPSDATMESEAGNRSHEYVTIWAPEKSIPLYENFWSSFMGEFRDIAKAFSAVSISMGPSGELHYPAYHMHDTAYRESRYPNRGLFQGSGALAHGDYIQYLKRHYKTLEEMNAEWGTHYRSLKSTFFPHEIQPADFDKRLYGDWIRTREAEVLFDWYHDSEMKYLEITSASAARLFWQDHDFNEIPISIKVPGVHWEENRYAELMNGLISLADIRNSQAGKWNKKYPATDLGYGAIFETLAKVQKEFPGHHFEVYSTAGSSPDGRDPFSRAQSIIRAQAVAAKTTGVILKLENALASDLYSQSRLDILDENFKLTGEHGITFLRLNDVVGNRELLARCDKWLRSGKDKEKTADSSK